ncbi:ClpXP protease specificity-enhancing factor [Pseudoxanthomonas dokdonensis]|uniref:Peptidase n=1 Tax=Pseudoxanthomonas dokdonensis TaxID=344882 RepID=A0A0R0CRV0_9GAMM|nr:ClpXP protease specificity-enhancing factor [Pseudoxanthomonas dokdonensis]KRG69170.1 peptidase [Pseudoxanthomonas dokdonensis]
MTDHVPAMTSYRPYLLRALAEWIADNDMTPHLLVDATQPGVQVPASTVKEGKVVLNIAQRAVQGLHIDNHSVSFSARFGGVSFPVMVPMSAVVAIYSRETGQGMALPEDTAHTADPQEPSDQETSAEDSGNPYVLVSDNSGDGDDDTPSPPTPSTGKRPHLRVVK